MDFNFIKKLVQLVDSSTITELEIEEKETKIKIARKIAAASPSEGIIVHQPAHFQAAQPFQAAPHIEKKESPVNEADENLHEILSPIVGTFYRSSSPDADAYVQPGDQVSVGSTLCIIEAMKLMNEIESDVNGKIVKILVENGKPVEYNQPLFLIQVD